MMKNKVGVIIVSYNQSSFLRRLFISLAEQTFNEICIYFVDNCSKDDSVILAKELSLEYKLESRFFELKENIGYTGGNNYGVREAVKDGCKYCLILNSDTEPDKHCLMALIECIGIDKNIAASGPILLLPETENRKATIQEFGAQADFINYRVRKNFTSEIFNMVEEKIPELYSVNFITGACFLIKSSVYENIGLFDERYFAYGEEIDFFKKINDAGLKVFVTKKARVMHFHDWTGKNKRGYYIEYYLIQRNKYLYFRKHGLKNSLIRNIIKDILMYPVYLPWFLRICDFRLSLYYLKGTFDGLMNIQGIPQIILKNNN